MVIILFNEILSISTNIIHSVFVDSKVSLECFMLLQQALDSSKCVSIILTGYQCHFLVDPCLLFLNICYKLLVLQGLLQTLPPSSCQLAGNAAAP